MNIEELLKKPEFKSISKEHLETFQAMCSELKGKEQMEQMAILMKYSKSFSGENKISKQEQQLMIKIMLDEMSQDDRESFNKILEMTNVMK